MRTRLPLLAGLLLAVCLPAAAQEAPKAKASFELKAAGPGRLELRVELAIEPGWHVYSTTEKNGAPTTLELKLPPGVTAAGPLVEPAAHVEEVQYVGKVSVHRGTLVLVQPLRTEPGAKGAVEAKLVWQTCDDGNTMCLPPDDAAATLQVPGGGDAAPVGSPTTPSAPTRLPPLAPPAAPGKVAVRVTVDPPEAPPGGTFDLVVDLAMRESFHIYSLTEEKGHPTSVELKLPPGVNTAGRLLEPPPHVITQEVIGELQVHEGTIRLTRRLVLERSVKDGETRTIGGKVAWMVCDANGCELGEAPFEVVVTAKGEPVGDAPPAEPAPQPATEPAAPGPAATPPAAAKPAGRGLLGLTWAAIVLGLLMLLQPCTYPMIPITVSIFSKGKALPRRTAILRAGVYAAGIIISFVAIGALVQVLFGAGGQGKLNQLATNPWVNLGIGAIFVYFAFSFFGYYELGLPAPLVKLMQMGSAKRDAEGTVPAWSLFLMGFFFCLTSYTCGAPIVLALFTTSVDAPHPMSVIWATAVFATTVALPFFALSLAPGSVRSLPRSGEWFSVFKAVLGFLELAFGLKFFRTADVAWDLGLLPPWLLLGLWSLLCAATAVYLLGRLPLRFPHDPDLKAASTGRGFWGGAFAALALVFALAAPGWLRLPSAVNAFLLVEAGDQGATDDSDPCPPLRHVVFGGLKYVTERAGLEPALAEARRTGEPVFLMFTGHT